MSNARAQGVGYLRLFPASTVAEMYEIPIKTMILVGPPNPTRPTLEKYLQWSPNLWRKLTCLAVPLQHGAVGDDIGLDLRLRHLVA